MPANKTILVVDDEEIVRDVARAILKHFGYKTLLAESAAAASALIRENADEIDVVLLDANMPRFVIDPRFAVIVSSGDSTQEAVRRFAPNRVAGFLQKPYDASRLRDAIGLALQSRSLAA